AIASNSAGAVTNFKLFENYPNPFNSSTVITYQVPEATDIKIYIYNVLGQKVASLVDKHHKAGIFRVSWDGKDSKGRLAPSGIYFTKLEANGFSDCKKMLLVQ
ncbi:MAG: T9SS type A sorting domain-containing protein, partial [bacterium]|nr:T9SS type A sorting domain-containing protein [bacterium]